MLHTKFRRNRPENMILKSFTIYWHVSYVGNVTSIMLMDFHFLVHKSFQNCFENGQVVT